MEKAADYEILYNINPAAMLKRKAFSLLLFFCAVQAIGPGGAQEIDPSPDTRKSMLWLDTLFDGNPRSGAAVFYNGPMVQGSDANSSGDALISMFPGNLIAELPQPPLIEQSALAAGKRSLILVQIDGLGHKPLLDALEQGFAPNLAALLDKGGYKEASYRNGIPAVTVPIQSQIFYGKNMPGNEWYSKTRDAWQAGNVREREVPPESGLMSGGRTYLSELSGGAEESADVNRVFLESVDRKGTFLAVVEELRSGGPLFLRYLFTHGLFSFPRFLYRLATDTMRMKRHMRESGFNTALDKKAPFFMALIANLWSPIAMEGLKKAARDKAPVAYADFSSYDEAAHYYGAHSQQAFQALSRIDAMIGEIASATREHGGRLLVFSDHGQTPTENFIKKFKTTPQKMVDELVRQVDPNAGDGVLVFSHVYSMGNIYVKGTGGRLEDSAMEARYPQLLRKLSDHPGIGMVATREKGKMILLSKSGRTVLDREGQALSREGNDPRLPYLDESVTAGVLAAQLWNYLDLEESGDIVVFAPYEGGVTVDYNHKYTFVSEHGGLGGDQVRPFVLYNPEDMFLKAEDILDARGLHQALRHALK